MRSPKKGKWPKKLRHPQNKDEPKNEDDHKKWNDPQNEDKQLWLMIWYMIYIYQMINDMTFEIIDVQSLAFEVAVG